MCSLRYQGGQADYFQVKWDGFGVMGWIEGTEQMNGWDSRYVGEVN